MSAPVISPRERSVVMCAQSVRDILDDRKVETRRVIVPQPSAFAGAEIAPPSGSQTREAPYFDNYRSEIKTPVNPRGLGQHWCWWDEYDRQGPDWIRCPYGVPGDRLWVKEAWSPIERLGEEGGYDYFATYVADGFATRQAIALETFCAWERRQIAARRGGPLGIPQNPRYMPRWASRILLEITNIRAHRIQEISEADIIAEGCPDAYLLGRNWFRPHWESLHGPDAWTRNDYVFAVSFRRLGGEA